MKFQSVKFVNYKAFKNFDLRLSDFNVLVGQNNAGKSTILSGFKILSEGIKKARHKKPEFLMIKNERTHGYTVDISDLPIAANNIFTDYDDSLPAEITFKFTGQSEIRLIFPGGSTCIMRATKNNLSAHNTAEFKRMFPLDIGFIPVLGPVENEEPVYSKETARRALLSYGAARNFRNIWYHYPEEFEEFKQMLSGSWAGMEITPPVVDADAGNVVLHMFCKENRIERELYWSGFGFQVWCQMLTAIVKNLKCNMLVVDEPDIYLHPDLQRRLVHILDEIPCDVILATHSTEIISEVSPESIVIVDKRKVKSVRIKSTNELPQIFFGLGSQLNPNLTQIAKTKKVLFVEGGDFKIISQIAKRVGEFGIATRRDITVVPLEGFRPQKVIDMKNGIEAVIGDEVSVGVILDRDYRSDEEIQQITNALNQKVKFAYILPVKEIENYVLNVDGIRRALEKKLQERHRRSETQMINIPNIESLLDACANEYSRAVSSQYAVKWPEFMRTHSGTDNSTIVEQVLQKFDIRWQTNKLDYCPGKDVLSDVNRNLGATVRSSLTAAEIIAGMDKNFLIQRFSTVFELIKSL